MLLERALFQHLLGGGVAVRFLEEPDLIDLEVVHQVGRGASRPFHGLLLQRLVG